MDDRDRASRRAAREGAGAGGLCHHGGMSFVLVFVDVQENFLDGSGAVPDAAPLRGELAALLDRARATGTPVVHVLNDGGTGEPDEPFTPGWQPVFPAREEEPVFRKTEPDAFTSPGLAGALALTGARGLVLAGFQSEFCISATARRALGEGYDVVLARGAHGTYPEGGATAAERAADVERGLEAAGIGISPAREIEFR
ncbi:Nicotinamidase-related amidase [Nocardiopsis flavescens]|uniref:Nicotinamidase-related amidase n=2 Tax=Nocardiopsis flavescens TaxID=758803 RepID=A0A1M6EL69_9ACTN|nr:Nicotinamidase-related amidase [Nocardiopsis flavescens]